MAHGAHGASGASGDPDQLSALYRIRDLRVQDASLPHLTATKLLAWWKEVSPGDRAPSTPVDDIVRRLGFAVATFHASAHPGTLGYLEPGEDLIFLRAGLPEPVRRFTLAHELGHALMHRPSPSLGEFQSLGGYDASACAEADLDGASGDWDLGDEALRPGQAYSARARREAEANQFASELLLPADLVRATYVDTPSDRASIRTLARRFAVSEDVALRRMTALLTCDFGSAKTSHSSTETDKKDERSSAELSAEQRPAAESPTPALVIAGPGTGKTSTLVGRIAWLIREQQVEPQRILALTFSNKAAREMRDRVGPIIAAVTDEPEQADEVAALRSVMRMPTISTIHAYCGELLRRYGQLVGLRPDFLLVGPTEGYFLLRSLVEQLPLTYYQPVTAPSHYYPDLLAAVSRAKDELVGPVEYTALAEAMRESARTAEERERAERACEVARVYIAYQTALDERGDADFGDIIRLAVRLLQEQPDVLAEERALRAYVLVDEFQDINRAMGVFLRTLTGEVGTLWAVGDADQAIYRFRGASPANIQRFHEDYPGARIQRLGHNYRSKAPILQAAASVAKRYIPAAERQPLVAARGSGSDVVRLAIAPDENAELEGIVRTIRARLDQGRSLAEIAVLCRTRRNARKIIEALERAKIPTRVVAPLLEQDEIKRILSVALLVADGGGTGLLGAGQLAAHPIPREDVLRLLELARERGVALLTLVREGLNGALDLAPDTMAALERLVEAVSALRLAPDVATGLARYLFEVTALGQDLLAGVAAGDETAQLRAAHVARLLSLARAFEGQGAAAHEDATAPKPGDARWAEFLDYLRVLTELRQDAAGGEEMLASADEGVWVLTVHASKGLEFPVILLPGLAERRFPVQSRHDFTPPPAGMIEGEGAANDDPHLIEEACLFYVALTRARDELALSVAERYGAVGYRPSRFLAPIEASLGKRLAHEFWNQPASAETQAAVRRSVSSKSASDQEPLTAFALETYQRCPRQFAYRYVDRLQPHSASMTALQVALKRSLEVLRERSREDTGDLALEEALTLFESAYDEARSGKREDDPYAPLYRRYGRIAVEREWQALTASESGSDRATSRVAEHDREVQVRVDDDVIQLTIDQVEHPQREIVGGLRLPDVAELRYVRRKLGAADDRGGLREYLYTLAAEQRANGKAPAQVVQRHLTTGVTSPVALSERRRTTLRRDLQAILDGIHREDYPARPDPRACAACPFLLICPS
jgi:superfamily I DNA/RNA helicase/Zn-dependent peptidase ImmA (M78 family)/CRISPR/Cas system-associated exonuclease Cas4 (RecB family)